MEKSYICPNIQICPIYQSNSSSGKIDPLRKNDKEYFCKVLESFNKRMTPEKLKESQFPAECSLVELLNNSQKLLNLCGKGTL